MTTNNVHKYLDQRRWLMEQGLITGDLQENLYVYGILLHSDIRNVDVIIDTNNKVINYKIFVSKDLLNKINKYNKLLLEYKNGTIGLFNRVIFKFMLKKMSKKQERLDFDKMLNSSVKDLCGPKWNITCSIFDINGRQDETGNLSDKSAH